PGADAEIMDQDVTDVLEEEINTIEGVKSIQSTSTEGRSQIVVEFILSKNVDVAAQEVRDMINQAQRQLPTDLEPPIVSKLNIDAQPIIWVAVTSAGDYRRMGQYADQVLRERLQTVPGVGSVMLGGFRDRQVRIWLDPHALESRGLTATDVSNAIQRKHVELPGGRIEQRDRELVVKVQGEYETVDSLRELVVLESGGSVVYLKDVAEVLDGEEDFRSVVRYNSIPSIGLGIRKQSGTNTVAVASAVREMVEQLAAEAPSGINVQIASDSSRFIENSMNDTLFGLFLGGLLTSVVMLVFLRNIRMTLISILALPTSIVGAFVVMYFAGFTINNMTMLAMSLAIGLVIDDTIVVLENIFRHMERLGEGAMDAARNGVGEVGFAVIATSMTIMAVFVPVAFMEGIIGRFFLQFGLSVALAIVVSTTLSLTLTPMLCSRFLRHTKEHGPIFRMFENAFVWFEGFYKTSLRVALRNRWLTVGGGALFFLAGMALIPVVEKTFSVQPDESQFLVRLEFPVGSSIHQSDSALREAERVLFAQDEVSGALTAVGLGGGSVNTGISFVTLVRPGQREAGQDEVMRRLRREFAEQIPNARISVEPASPIGGGQRNADLEYIVQGPDVQELRRVSDAIMADMRDMPGFIDVDDNLRLNKPEVKVSIDREMADNLGVDVLSLSQDFSILMGGMDVARFKDGGNRYDIRLRARPDARENMEDLLQLAVRSSSGELVRTANLVQIEETEGPNSINRFNRMRAVNIYANLEGVPLADAIGTMNEIADRHVPDDPAWSTALSGQAETFAEAFRYLLIAIMISLIMIYVILGSQFESFIHPFTILMSVPLAAIGGLGLLVITNHTLDIFSFIGMIMLIGIVTKNGILLVDFINQRRGMGLEREEAILEAAPLRLRPILMTAFTTIAAVVPIALAMSEGGEQRAPMGVAVIGGMLTSTFLTLLVIPCVYSLMDDFAMKVRRTIGRYVAPPEESITPDPHHAAEAN
ncbi:MAG: efflux RND transporter permease subunit, partial [Candidatus Sumerlaeia bacterium]|nr:efflux RND transporter permease subunit [Candidatus Sumerlaeia bacterium]